ncbi:penicillin-binding protein [Rurimicrobium arvi]|uniref:Penicillin-binding protein n=1 Tax=Rurimicrobium arvi TaxID=2049916 RepID=A0ABP8MHK8_9BACT
MNVRRDIRFRVYLAFSGICVLGLAIIVKAALIQAKDGASLRARAQSMSVRTDTIFAERGNIYTEDGTMLCSTIPQFDVHLDMAVIKKDTFYKHIDTLAYKLSELFRDASAAQYKSDLTKAYKDSARYYELGTKIPYDKYLVLRTFPIFNKGARRGGMIVSTRNTRDNPYGFLALQTVGKYQPAIWRDKKLVRNVKGLEAMYDSILSGKNGWYLSQRIAPTKWASIEGSRIEAQNGKDIVTTIDIGIQNIAEHALLDALRQYNCWNGTCIVMEVSTGKIRAMANLGTDIDKQSPYSEDKNYALTLAEPGSTFKIVTLLSLLKDGLINVEDNVNCYGGQRQFAFRVMHDSHHGLGVMPIKNAYAQSSNVAMGSLAYEHYYKEPERFIKHIKELHLNSKTGIDLFGESKAIVTEPHEKNLWNAATLPWLATGYGVMVTPLHTCMIYNAVANNGRLMKPYLVSSIREYGREVKRIEPTVLEESVASKEVISQLRKCTEEVVLSGTGKHIQSPYYKIAGKTGTAQVCDKGIPYSARVYQGSFVGYFPADNPKYTMIVVIRTKKNSGSYYGGTIAAPVFRMVADKIFANGQGVWKGGPVDSFSKTPDKGIVAHTTTVFNQQTLLNAINLKSEWNERAGSMAAVKTDSSHRVVLASRKVVQNLVPDVVGMSLKDAVYVLERQGLKVRVMGAGVIQSQSLVPGSAVRKGQIIIIQLS